VYRGFHAGTSPSASGADIRNSMVATGIRLGIFMACALAYLWARNVTLPMERAPDGHYVLADPDSYMRWRLVTRAVNGEGVQIRWMNEDNAPFGRMNDWTSPMTILGAGLVHAAEAFGGMTRDQALEWGGVWLGPVVGLFSLAALGWLGWRAGGWTLAACWMVAWPMLEDVIQITRCGHTDHDSLHQLLLICIVGGCLACAQKPSVLGGVLVGLASAAGMWSAGSELLPALGLVAGLAVYETGWRSKDDKRMRFWRGWWIAGLVGTAVAWLFEFWPHVFHGRLEYISVWHVIACGVCGGLLELLYRSKAGGWEKLAMVGAAVGLVLFAAATARKFDWVHLHIVQDKQYQNQAKIISEALPFAPNGLGEAMRKLWWKYGLLPVCALAAAYRFSSVSLRVRWLALVMVVFFVLMWRQLRWMDLFAPAL